MAKSQIGVDIGATNVRVCLGDINGIKSKVSEKLNISDKNSIAGQVIRLIKNIGTEFSAIGVGSIGPLDLKKGEILPVNIPLKNIPLVKPLEEEFGVPVLLVNDCDAGVIGEKVFGLGKNENNLAYLTISTGIGCGVIVNNKLILGKDGNATEVGHFTVDLESKMKCGCGAYGHWEAYCSGRNIPNFVRHSVKDSVRLKDSLILKLSDGNLDNLTPERFFEAAKMQDELALEILDRIGKINAIGISNINAAYDVSLVAVGGSVALNNQDLILDPLLKHLPNYSINRLPKVSITKLGEDAVLYGALALALNPEILEDALAGI